MRVIIAGGTGLIGRALSVNLAADDHDVIVLSRAPEQAMGVPNGVRLQRWDAARDHSLSVGAEARAVRQPTSKISSTRPLAEPFGKKGR